MRPLIMLGLPWYTYKHLVNLYKASVGGEAYSVSEYGDETINEFKGTLA